MDKKKERKKNYKLAHGEKVAHKLVFEYLCHISGDMHNFDLKKKV